VVAVKPDFRSPIIRAYALASARSRGSHTREGSGVIQDRAVIFDLWGTLVPVDDAAWTSRVLPAMARACSAPATVFAERWRASFDQRVTGDLESNLRSVCASMGIGIEDVAVQKAIALRVAFHRRSFVPRPDGQATLRQLREAGFRIGLISDCSSEVPDLWHESSLASLVDEATFSCLVGIKKPNPRIYELTSQRLGVDPRACVYVGDGASNELVGAEAVGMRSILLRTDDRRHAPAWSGEVVSTLSAVVPLVSRSR